MFAHTCHISAAAQLGVLRLGVSGLSCFRMASGSIDRNLVLTSLLPQDLEGRALEAAYSSTLLIMY